MLGEFLIDIFHKNFIVAFIVLGVILFLSSLIVLIIKPYADVN